MKIYIVFQSNRTGGFYYKEDEFDDYKSYRNKPLAIFFSRRDALEYVKERNAYLYDDEDDGPTDNIWAIENGYY